MTWKTKRLDEFTNTTQTVSELLRKAPAGDLPNSILVLEQPVTGLADAGVMRPVKSATVKLLQAVRPSLSQRKVLVVVLYMGEQVSLWVPGDWQVRHGH